MTTRPDRMERRAPSRVLLVLDISIAGVRYIPPALSKRKELAVFLGPKTCLPHSLALVAQCVEGFSFTITRWRLRTSDFATSERAAAPSNRTKVALIWMKRTTRLRIAESCRTGNPEESCAK